MGIETEQPTRFKNQIKQNVDKNSKIYPYARNLYRVYCNLAGPFHTLPDFLIIGAARSGTTSLYEYLIQHSSIYSAIGKEVYDDLSGTGTIDVYDVIFTIIPTVIILLSKHI